MEFDKDWLGTQKMEFKLLTLIMVLAAKVLIENLNAIRCERMNTKKTDGSFICLGSSIRVCAWIDEL